MQAVKLLSQNKHYDIFVCEPRVELLPKYLMGLDNLSLSYFCEICLDGFDHADSLVQHDPFIIKGKISTVSSLKEKVSV